MTGAHDFAAQKAETYATFARIRDEAGTLPDTARIDYAFLPGDTPDWDAVLAALAEQGFDCARVEPGPDDGPDGPWLEASLTDQPLSASAVWLGEEMATRTALPFGFRPDGWGFLI
ncbi:ribonuclease E inhibitor RraB [Thalassococcus sp. BH17M4-6]|uniref:ribonuclease E inhibitor RraB n=1 Tax=Thalassococcus sp. BH17M4-6 TaxID=3413148 RepID=UPI003BD2FC9A